jgi:hypothetical protein
MLGGESREFAEETPRTTNAVAGGECKVNIVSLSEWLACLSTFFVRIGKSPIQTC